MRATASYLNDGLVATGNEPNAADHDMVSAIDLLSRFFLSRYIISYNCHPAPCNLNSNKSYLNLSDRYHIPLAAGLLLS